MPGSRGALHPDLDRRVLEETLGTTTADAQNVRVRTARRTDTTTLEERALCTRFEPIARAFFLRHVGAGADDLAQEALVALLEAVRAGRVRETDRIGGYFLGICRNLARRRARDHARRARAFARLDDGETQSPVEPPIDLRRLWGCFNTLGARARDVLVRTFVDEEDAPTIGAALTMSEGNVRVVRHRALAALARCVEGEPEEAR